MHCSSPRKSISAIWASQGPPRLNRLIEKLMTQAALARYSRVFTPRNIARIRDMAENGSSSFEIAQAIGSTPASVRVLCSHHKIRIKRRQRATELQHTPSRMTHGIVAHMPASLYVEFQHKAEHLRMSPSVLASNLLAAITISDIFAAVLDDQD